MSYDQERGEEEPSLTEMTEKAIEVLQTNDKGFLLVVEGSYDASHKLAFITTIAEENAVSSGGSRGAQSAPAPPPPVQAPTNKKTVILGPKYATECFT